MCFFGVQRKLRRRREKQTRDGETTESKKLISEEVFFQNGAFADQFMSRLNTTTREHSGLKAAEKDLGLLVNSG